MQRTWDLYTHLYHYVLISNTQYITQSSDIYHFHWKFLSSPNFVTEWKDLVFLIVPISGFTRIVRRRFVRCTLEGITWEISQFDSDQYIYMIIDRKMPIWWRGQSILKKNRMRRTIPQSIQPPSYTGGRLDYTIQVGCVQSSNTAPLRQKCWEMYYSLQ